MTDEPDGPRAAPGDVQPDGRIMTIGVGGLAGYPVGRGTLWVTEEQATQAAEHGWRCVGDVRFPGLVQVTR